MNVNPLKVIELGILKSRDGSPIPEECIQQVGVDVRIATEVVLEPKGFVNTEIYEQFNMQNYFGKPTIRSSFSRKGVFISSGEYDPGFCGIGGISIYNFSENKVTIPALTRIAQMVVFPANSAKMYDGHYNKVQSIDSKLKDV